MGFRFRRSVKLFPGVRLNFSRSGISTSVGVRGAHVTAGKNGTRTTVGIPGTGLSYTDVQPRHPNTHATQQEPDSAGMPKPRAAFRWWTILLGLFLLFVAIQILLTTIAQ